ncbi:MAG: Nif3-like dinuclear metal center hexameric protein, partial [Eubacteriales bacterium]
SYYAAHTNLDQSILSSSLTFARILGLKKTELLASIGEEKLVKIVVFVPEDSAETVRKALAEVGVGAGSTDGEHSANYKECFYQGRGEGTFRPLEGADPTIGKIGELTRVPEVRLESIVEEKALSRAVRALHKAHPYEEPAYDLIPLKNSGKKRGYGVVGYLQEPVTLGELWENFLDHLKRNSFCKADGTCPQGCCLENQNEKIFPFEYDLSSVRLAGDLNRKIRKVAISNGSGGSFVSKAIFKGADLYITGDIDHHGVLDSMEAGMAVGALGHFLSEMPMMESVYQYLKANRTMEAVDIVISSDNAVPWVK